MYLHKNVSTKIGRQKARLNYLIKFYGVPENIQIFIQSIQIVLLGEPQNRLTGINGSTINAFVEELRVPTTNINIF